MAKRLILVLIGALVATLSIATVAIAGWTPQDIYDDFVTNGTLTRDYTTEELNAYLNDATLAQYADQDTKKKLDDLIKDREDYPFTGFQIAIFAIVVVALVGGGFALRYLSRPQKPSQKN
jgi:uncharacterized protein YcnI